MIPIIAPVERPSSDFMPPEVTVGVIDDVERITGVVEDGVAKTLDTTSITTVENTKVNLETSYHIRIMHRKSKLRSL